MKTSIQVRQALERGSRRRQRNLHLAKQLMQRPELAHCKAVYAGSIPTPASMCRKAIRDSSY